MRSTGEPREEPRRRTLTECLFLGVGIAVFLSGIALVVGVLGILGGSPPAGAPLPVATGWEILLGYVVLAYSTAGILGSLAYYQLQWTLDRYLGQAFLSFILGVLAYGSIGLVGAFVYSRYGINLFDNRSPAEAWNAIPSTTLGLGVIVGVMGPFLWKALYRRRGS